MPAQEPHDATLSVAGRPPRKWKQIALAFGVVYPVVTLLNTLLVPQIGFIPQPFRGMIVVLCMATVLTYVLPWASARSKHWLAR